MYGGVRENGLAQSCRETLPTLSRVVDHNRIAFSMYFLKARLIELRERSWAIIVVFADSSVVEFLNNAELPFYQREYLGERNGRTKDEFFNAVLQALNPADAVKPTKTSDWRTMFDLTIEDIKCENRKRGALMFSRRQRFTTVTLTESGISRFRYFYDLYVGQSCFLIGLHQLLPERLFMIIFGCRFIFTCENCLAQFRNEDVRNEMGTEKRLFVIATAAYETGLWVSDYSYQCVHHAVTLKSGLADVLEMFLITIPAH